MKVDSMRFLDQWVGIPVSAVLTASRKLGDLIRQRPIGSPRRILIVKLVEQGATVVAEPALRRAVDLVGQENVFMVVFRKNRFILDVLDIVPAGNVITIRSSNLIGLAIDTLRALRRVRREGVDTAVDFEFFSRFSGAFTYLTGATRRVGFHSFAGEAGYRGDLMTHRVAYNIILHASQTYRVLIETAIMDAAELPGMPFIVDKEQPASTFVPRAEEIAEVKELLLDSFGTDTVPRIVLLNANSGDLLPLRRWPVGWYIALAERLLAHDPHVVIAFTGSPDERKEADNLAARVQSARCISLGGRTTLRQLLVLYGLAEVLVTNDSGPAHYASLTPIDVVTLFGPESPAIFGALTDRNHVVWAGLACSPCVNAFNQRLTTCTNNLCMQRISTDEVFATVCRVLDQRDNVERIKSNADKRAADKRKLA